DRGQRYRGWIAQADVARDADRRKSRTIGVNIRPRDADLAIHVVQIIQGRGSDNVTRPCRLQIQQEGWRKGMNQAQHRLLSPLASGAGKLTRIAAGKDSIDLR